MTIFTIFTIVYYIVFVAILILALAVHKRLRVLARQLSIAYVKEDGLHHDASSFHSRFAGKVSTTVVEEPSNHQQYKSADSFLLYKSPNFPLSALVKILPGTFVGFGILGTFLGFSDGISGMRLTGNVDELFGKLDVFFSGLNTAFVTSIAGVVLSVLFGTILYQWPLNKIQFHCARIRDELSKTQVSPAEAAKSEADAYIGSLQEMTKTLLHAKDTMERSLVAAAGKIEALPQKFLDVGHSLEQSVSPVKDTFAAMQSTLSHYAEQAAALQSASGQIQASLAQFVGAAAQANEKVNQSLERTISATQGLQENSAKMNEHILESQKAALEGYQEIDEKIASILGVVNKNISDYSEAVQKSLVQTLEEYNKAAQKVTESFFGARND